MEKGKLYGIGAGPGDPEYLTLKAVRIIKETNIIAVPGETAEKSAAFQIAAAAVPEIREKKILSVPAPMVKEREQILCAHRKAAEQIRPYLDQGENIAFLTLGDPSIYSTFIYLKMALEEDGYETEMISGVPSFCAAAARLNTALTIGNETLVIIPGTFEEHPEISPDKRYVLMKAGKKLANLKKQLEESGREACMAENCTMENEKLYFSLADMPEEAGYFSLLIV